VRPDARLLILGSLPGDASIAAGQYYGHPRNSFWRLLGDVLDLDLSGMSYPERLSALAQRRIGLWDVLAQAERPGSLDAGLLDARPNDLSGLVSSLPDLKAVAFNGAWAARAGLKQLASFAPEVARINLPSSSPAHTQAYADKLASWQALRPPLGAGSD
jgi:TDG/mug DNA glycosylase family protein